MELQVMCVPKWTGVILFCSAQMYTQQVTDHPGQQQFICCFVIFPQKKSHGNIRNVFTAAG